MARTKRKLSPNELYQRYCDKFWRRVNNARDFLGRSECKLTNTPTRSNVFSFARAKGKKVFNDLQRLKEKQKAIKIKSLLAYAGIVAIAKAACNMGLETSYTTTQSVRTVLQDAGRLIGSLIFEIPTTRCGWVTEQFLKKKAENSKLQEVEEHIYPRQFDGEVIVHHAAVMGGLSFDEFFSYIEVFTQVAISTKEENSQLGNGPQKRDTFITPEHAYDQLGVKYRCPEGHKIKRLEDVCPEEVLMNIYENRLETYLNNRYKY